MKTDSIAQLVKGAFIALTAFILGSAAAQAQATRTWVSGVGDDANPCSRTAPCKTFAGAISKTAAGGEISVLDPGGFGAVTITKSITISGDGTLAGILNSGFNGVIINGANVVVTLRNLSINGAGTGTRGVQIILAGTVNIENCSISGIGGSPGDGVVVTAAAAVNIENSTISGVAGTGVNISTTAVCKVNIKNTIIRNCTAGAVHATTTAASPGVTVNISRCSLTTSLFGFRADNAIGAILDDCVLAGNVNNGALVAATSGASSVSVNRCTINDNAGSGAGVAAVGALSTARISDCTIFDNLIGVLNSGGSAFSAGNNRIRDNNTDVSGTLTPAGQQ